LKVHINFIA